MNLDPRNILVYFMDDPERQPEVISEEYSKYFQIGWYMSHNHEIDEVDVWIRHRKHHSLTTDGLFWEYTRPTQTVVKSATTLEVDVVDVRTRDRYIVALLQDESRKESPVLLNLGKGRGSCCDSNCSNLWFHLRNIWPSQCIVRAQRFSDSQGDPEVSSKVLSWPLNEHYFDNQKNELYLECKPEVINCEPSDVVNKMEGAEKP
ncbi:hypothetical protein CPB86DRAFT_180060 [Serendipita vermifera]|nr:hypothetical protein CPB86DRAFT_180060 [Serendipita vermifera]